MSEQACAVPFEWSMCSLECHTGVGYPCAICGREMRAGEDLTAYGVGEFEGLGRAHSECRWPDARKAVPRV